MAGATNKSNIELAHLWASQNVQEGRSSNRNLFFEGATIYSYGKHFPLARFIDAKHIDLFHGHCVAKKDVVLINNCSYSSTTIEHRACVYRAIRGLDLETYRVCDPLNYQASLDGLIKEVHEWLELGVRRIDRNTVSDQNAYYAGHIERLKKFAKLFKLKLPKKEINKLAALNEKVNDVTLKRALKKKKEQEKWNALSEEERNKRTRDKEVKREWKRVQEILRVNCRTAARTWDHHYKPRTLFEENIARLDEATRKIYHDNVALIEAANARAEASRQAEIRNRGVLEARHRALIPEAERVWKEQMLQFGGYSSHIASGVRDDLIEALRLREREGTKPTMIRLNMSRNEIETSRGAFVPIREGKKLFALYHAVMNRWPTWMISIEDVKTLNGRYIRGGESSQDRWIPTITMRVGHYELNHFTKDGDAKIGCHTLTKAEIDDFIKRVGWDKEVLS